MHFLFQDPHACGEIILGSSNDGFKVDEDVPAKYGTCMYIFMLHTPHRGGGGFPLQAKSEEAKKEWMECLSSVINESIGTPDESIATSTYEDDEDLYASICELKS